MGAKKGGKKRFWSDEEKVSICGQARAPGVSVAQVARRYAMNANLIHKWLCDPRFAPDGSAPETEVADFLPVEIEGMASPPSIPQFPAPPIVSGAPLSAQRVDITLSDGRRILVEGTTGYSMGAAISVAFAAKHPERVEKLILVAPAGMSDTVDGLDKLLRDTPVIGDWFTLVLGGKARKKRHAATVETDPKRTDFAAKQLAESDYRGFLPAVLSSARHMLKKNQTNKHQALENERVLTLAVWGEDDAVIPLSALGGMTQANRSVVHETVAGADHGLPYTHPSEVTAAIKSFLLGN